MLLKKSLAPYSEYRDYPIHWDRLEWIYTLVLKENKEKKISVLDIGCGTGNITIPLGTIPHAEILGIDIEQRNIEICKQKSTFENIAFKLCNIQEINLQHFDIIILTEVLEHIPNYASFLDYLGKNMSCNATLLLTIPNGYGPFEFSQIPLYLLRKIGLGKFISLVKKAVGKKEPYSTNQEETPHINFFTMSSFKKDLDKNNLFVYKKKKAFVFASIIETYLPMIPLQKIAKIDNWIAQRLPYFMVSGWYFCIKRKR